MINKYYSKTVYIVLCGLFAALTAICSLITIPLGFTPIPFNLGTLAVFLSGGLLGKKYGTISLMVYVLLGAVGLPVFSGFTGGMGVLVGPTGGYLPGYIAAGFITGLIIDSSHGKSCNTARRFLFYSAAMIPGLTVCYALGIGWFMISTGTGLWAALISCVFPFLPADALKIMTAAVLIKKLRPHLR